MPGSETVSKIPIFPLGIVILPDQTVPLHIFEERYKLMIQRCLQQQSAFGIIFYDGKDLARCGCTAMVTDVIERYADGRMDILTLGGERFRITQIDESEPYLQAEVEYFDDLVEPSTEQLDRLTRRAKEVLRQYWILTAVEDRSFPEADSKQLSFVIAGSDGFTPAEKQKFLEMTSTGARLEKSVAALEKVVERLELSAAIRKIIGGNGRLSPAIYRKINNRQGS